MTPLIVFVTVLLLSSTLAAYFCYVTHRTATDMPAESELRWLGMCICAATVGSFIGAAVVAYVVRSKAHR